MPSRTQVNDLVAVQNKLAEGAKQALQRLWPSLSDDLDEAKAQLKEAYPAIAQEFGNAAATVAAEWFEDTMDLEAVVSADVDEEDAKAAVGWAMSNPYKTGDIGAGLAAAQTAMERLVKQPARDTVMASAARHGRTFARVPAGNTTCGWCIMLASRGFVYSTSSHAGQFKKFHRECDCQIVPSDGKIPEGYDPDALYDEYTAARAELEAEGIDPTDANIGKRIDARRRGPKTPAEGGAPGGKPAGEWPNGIPFKHDGVPPYPSLAATPRIDGETGFKDQVSQANPNLREQSEWPEIWDTSAPYTVNCARASTALILRRLGYEVQAGAGSYRPSNGQFNSAEVVRRWIGQDGSPKQLLRYATAARPTKASNAATMSELRRQADGSFGVCRGSWEQGGGHIWCWEKRGGKLVFWDGQIGQQVPTKQYMGALKDGSFMFARLDDATPTDDALEVVSIAEPKRPRR